MPMDLTGQIALITGGGSGIGFAIAQAFAAAGAAVWVGDRDAKTIDELDHSKLPLNGVVADVGRKAEVDRLFDRVLEKSDGRLDILVNNAGVSGPNGPLETLELSDWEDTLRVNVLSTFMCTQRALMVMKKQQYGSIVNLSSTAGTHGFPLRTPYAAAKWAIVGLTKSLAMEVGGDGIRVNAICPGSVAGPRMDRVIAAEAQTRNMSEAQVRRQFVNQTSLKCFVEMEDVAQLALFICAESGAKISGQALAVDGHTESLSQFDCVKS